MTDRNLSTRVVHAGEQRPKPYHAVTTPIAQTSTFTFENTRDLVAYKEALMWGDAAGRGEYGRYGNPTIATVEAKLAALDSGEAACLFSSGMAAVTTTLFSLLSTGSHVIMTDDCYRRTRQFVTKFLTRFGVEVTQVPMGDYEALESAIRPNTKVILSESPTNPYLRVLDLDKLVAIAGKHNIKTVVDSTFATPINQRPLEFGVDFVVHSATKYLGGHNDLLAGVVVGSDYMIGAIKETQAMLGDVKRSPCRLFAAARPEDAGTAGRAAKRNRRPGGPFPVQTSRRASSVLSRSDQSPRIMKWPRRKWRDLGAW